jgi:hypothetical protein
MELPADLSVNGKPFVHLALSQGDITLHAALLEFYADAFGLDRVILRDTTGRISRVDLVDCFSARKSNTIKELIWLGPEKQVFELQSESSAK